MQKICFTFLSASSVAVTFSTPLTYWLLLCFCNNIFAAKWQMQHSSGSDMRWQNRTADMRANKQIKQASGKCVRQQQ